MIERSDMLELTRRMNADRACFIRVAGAYYDADGELEDTFNVNWRNLSTPDKTKLLSLARQIPFAKTNTSLREFRFPPEAKGKDTFHQLLGYLTRCTLKNDAMLEVFYELCCDGLVYDTRMGLYLFAGSYDVPARGVHQTKFDESEEVYDFLVCAVAPVSADYEPGNAAFGFLFPAFKDRSSDERFINIFTDDWKNVQEGMFRHLLGRNCMELVRQSTPPESN